MSIRNKLFLGISALVFLFIFLAVFFNRTFLLPFTINETKSRLLQYARELDTGQRAGDSGFLSNIQLLEWKSGVRFTLLSTKLDILYISPNRGPGSRILDDKSRLEQDLKRIIIDPPPPLEKGPRDHFAPREAPPEEKALLAILSLKPGQYMFQDLDIHDRNFRVLQMGTILKNGNILLLNKPVAALEESAGIASRFLFISGLIIFIVGMLAVYFFSRGFTKPIVELKNMAGAMARLDFSRQVHIRSGDEIGDLGRSINSLSDQLSRSINGLREANSRLQADIDRERKLEEMRKDFVSSVSHELKTPIALVRGYAEGLADGVAKKEDRDYYCGVIIDETAKMNRLLEDLLDLSQVESGVFRLNKKQFDLKELNTQVINKFIPILREREIHLEIMADPSVVYADPVRIEQILVNFINNAADHCSIGGKISVTIQKLNGKTRYGIHNTGQNIPRESLDKIWLRFYKTDPSRSRSIGGTGLGLAIVRAILEQHQAAYGAANTDSGVEFWFILDENSQEII